MSGCLQLTCPISMRRIFDSEPPMAEAASARDMPRSTRRRRNRAPNAFRARVGPARRWLWRGSWTGRAGYGLDDIKPGENVLMMRPVPTDAVAIGSGPSAEGGTELGAADCSLSCRGG